MLSLGLDHAKQSLYGERDVNKEWIALRCLPVNFLDELTITEIGSAAVRRRRRPACSPRSPAPPTPRHHQTFMSDLPHTLHYF